MNRDALIASQVGSQADGLTSGPGNPDQPADIDALNARVV